MRLEVLQARRPPGREGGHAAFGLVLIIAALALVARPARCETDPPEEQPGDGNPDSSSAHVAGSLTLRYQATEGSGNDRSSARYSLEWLAGRWSGAFTAVLENQVVDGAIHSEPGIGSVDLPERWIGWSHAWDERSLDLRLGTAHGLRFGEGLALGAARFDGLQARVGTGPVDFVFLAGRTEAITPDDFLPEPITLFPPDEGETFGTDGELMALRAELHPTDALRLGVNAVRATADGLPSADLASVDVAWTRGRLDLSGEWAVRESGGHGLSLRADVIASDAVVVGIERRDYADLGSPLGNAPLYGGLSAGDERDEDGWLLRVDFIATDRLSGSWSFDYSKSPDKVGAGLPTVRRDHRLVLDFRLAERTALGYGFELEDTSGGDDGQMHSLLVSHAFRNGGRLSGRVSLDRSTPGWRTSARVSYRQPLLDRRLTLLFDDSVRVEGGSISHSFTGGASVRLGETSFLTVRATAEAGDGDSVDVSWYRRF